MSKATRKGIGVNTGEFVRVAAPRTESVCRRVDILHDRALLKVERDSKDRMGIIWLNPTDVLRYLGAEPGDIVTAELSDLELETP
jgi:hypothetical protein